MSVANSDKGEEPGNHRRARLLLPLAGYEPDVVEEPSPDRVFAPSLAKTSAARFAGTLGTLFFGLLTGVITARSLGPSGKGTLAVLSFIGGLVLVRLCGLGLGQGSVILRARREAALEDVFSASLAPLLVTSSAGVLSLFIVMFATGWLPHIEVAIGQGLALVMAIYSGLFLGLLNAQERFGTTSVLMLGRDGLTALGTFLLVVGLRTGLPGAVAAAAVGEAFLALLSFRRLRAMGFRARPSWRPELLLSGLRFGLLVEVAYLLSVASQRADQLVVYQLAGPSGGGIYSVAITVAQLAAYAPGAISVASFPRIAYIGSRDGLPLVFKAARIGLLCALGAGLLLALVSPILVPMLYGEGFLPAVPALLVLLVGASIFGIQMTLARGAAAMDNPRVILESFGVNVFTMVALDYLLVPRFELVGAAVASVVGSLLGLAVCLNAFRIRFGWTFERAALVPSRADVVDLVTALRSFLASARRILGD